MKAKQQAAWPRRVTVAAVLLLMALTMWLPVGISQEQTRETPPDNELAPNFVGKLEGCDVPALVGIAADSKQFLAYVCSQDAGFNEKHSRWFKGEVKEGAFSATVDGMTLEGTVSPENIIGTFTDKGEHAFTAKVTTSETLAGLYRAEGPNAEGDHCVYGWVIDEDDYVVGAGDNKTKKKKETPKPTASDDIPGGVRVPGPNAEDTVGQQVKSPGKPAKGRRVKVLSTEERNALLATIAKRVAVTGGNPLLGLTISSVKRFLTNAKAEGTLENSIFTILKRVPAGLLKAYVKRWDAIPPSIREKLIGAADKKLVDGKVITADELKGLVGQLKDRFKPLADTIRAEEAAEGKGSTGLLLPEENDLRSALALNDMDDDDRAVGSGHGPLVKLQPFNTPLLFGQTGKKTTAKAPKQVRALELFCQRTSDRAAGVKDARDEILVTYLVVHGKEAFDRVTNIYPISKDQTRAFQAADIQLFPNLPTQEKTAKCEIIVFAGIFDSDDTDVKRTKDVIKSLIKVASEGLKIAGKDELATAAPAAEGLIDALAAGLEDADLLGTDRIGIEKDQTIVDPFTKVAKDKFVVSKKGSKAGRKDVYHYEIRGIKVR
ncbi:MAG TPA: hypothetical protein PLN21_21905 [Gemmatales bacterium]|nr:hypothetical protein [Gemmatales bacterium]